MNEKQMTGDTAIFSLPPWSAGDFWEGRGGDPRPLEGGWEGIPYPDPFRTRLGDALINSYL